MVFPNAAFHTREPLVNDDNLTLKHATGPFNFLNPTHAHYQHAKDTLGTYNTESKPQRANQIAFQWHSRDNRKGRHALVVQRSDSRGQYIVPESTQTFRAVIKGIRRMFTQYPIWDVSWLVAVIFTLGSVIWVINAFFVFLPLVQPQTEFVGEITVGGGVTAFIGAAVFEIGSILLMIEAVNENRSGCFGWALEQVVDDMEHGKGIKVEPSKSACRHHHTNKKNFVGKGSEKHAGRTGSSETEANTNHGNAINVEPSKKCKHNHTNKKNFMDKGSEKTVDSLTLSSDADATDHTWNSSAKETFQFFPSWHDLTHHYIYELGFLACSAQFFGATIFFISGFTALPPIYNMLHGAVDGAYWAPQVIGGAGFVVSSLLFMIETQTSWWKPNLASLGWHIGFWNLVGAIGFCGCGALGLDPDAQLAASAFTYFGSWAFLIGSVVQWYESLDTHPVEERSVSS